MKNSLDRKSVDAYWKYLEDNSKVVSKWPEWLKGDRSSSPEPSGNQNADPESESPDEKLAS